MNRCSNRTQIHTQMLYTLFYAYTSMYIVIHSSILYFKHIWAYWQYLYFTFFVFIAGCWIPTYYTIYLYLYVLVFSHAQALCSRGSYKTADTIARNERNKTLLRNYIVYSMFIELVMSWCDAVNLLAWFDRGNVKF